ncbi:interferon-induced protein 35 isoform X2 [Hoplias malabaricus]|uniref:interferon-induced protein 35 isoform X2 n=1 Tax=Hoplias malabaricus TaxID=27720 RepID=UPI0034627E29
MSSDEDFSIVSDEQINLQMIQKDIEKLKVQYETLLKDHKLFSDGIESNHKYTQEFQQRAVNLKRNLDNDRVAQAETVKKEQLKLDAVKQQNILLKTELMTMDQKLRDMEETNQSLRQQTEVSTAVPEKKVVFTGETANGAQALSFDMKPHIVYTMEGGTALITFEEEEVTEKILALKEHEVSLGDCRIVVQAEPVRFLVPSGVEMDTQVCPRRILVSNLPKNESVDRVLDKLEIYFSKKKNGGGEVEDIDMLDDSGNVVITFVDDDVAKGLTDKQTHEVELERGKKLKVKVTPFLNGGITHLQTCNAVCDKTVLLTGIPPVMDLDNLQDLLEIHFQKSANSGGEVDAIVYNPVGQRTLAVFQEDSSKDE